jgi:WD40 repeat protein
LYANFELRGLRQLISKRLIWVVLALAACSPGNAPTNNDRAAPTQPPPTWVEPVEAMSVENVANATYLGRLDQPGTSSTISAYSFSPDSTRLAGLSSEQLLIWDLISGELIAQTTHGEANQVFFSPDKTEVYTLNATNGSVSVYDAADGRSKNRIDAHNSYNNVQAFAADDGWLALGGTNGEVKVWDLLERRSLATLDAHTAQLKAMDFSPDGTLLLTGGDEGMAYVWDWRARERLLEVSLVEDNLRPIRVAFSPTGDQIAVGSQTDVRLYSFPDGELLQTLDIIDGGVSLLMAYSPDGQHMVTGAQEREVTVWNAATGELVAQLPGVAGPRMSAAFSPGGDLLLTSALNGAVNLWDMTRLAEATTNRADLDVGSNQIVYAEWTNDSRLMVFFDGGGAVFLWGVGAEQAEPEEDPQTASNP